MIITKHVFILAAAVMYVSAYTGGAVHELSIRSYKLWNVCIYVHTYYIIRFQQIDWY